MKVRSEQQAWVYFLRETTPEACSLQVRADFQGCWDHPLDIDTWIVQANTDRKLFEDYDVEVGTYWYHPNEPIDPHRQMPLVLDSYASDEELMDAVIAFKNLFREETGSEREAHPLWKPANGKYKLAFQPDLTALKAALAVYRAIKYEPKVKRYELGYALQKLGHRIAVEQIGAPDDVVTQTAVSNAVSKFYLWAKELIAGVEQGVFPVKKK